MDGPVEQITESQQHARPIQRDLRRSTDREECRARLVGVRERLGEPVVGGDADTDERIAELVEDDDRQRRHGRCLRVGANRVEALHRQRADIVDDLALGHAELLCFEAMHRSRAFAPEASVGAVHRKRISAPVQERELNLQDRGVIRVLRLRDPCQPSTRCRLVVGDGLQQGVALEECRLELDHQAILSSFETGSETPVYHTTACGLTGPDTV